MPRPKNTPYVVFRPSRSESDAQKMRPPMLNRLSRPANPAAADAVTRPLKISWIIGEATPSTPMPALTFRQSTAHNSQNWRVLHATLTGTDWGRSEDGDVSVPTPSLLGTLCGVQPGGGSR